MKIKNISKRLWGMLIACLIVIVTSFVSAEECIGQGCSMNFSLNVTPASNITISPIFSETGQAMYDLLVSSGAGIGTFFQFIGISLPLFLFLLVLITIIVAIVYSISKSIKLWKVATNEE